MRSGGGKQRVVLSEQTGERKQVGHRPAVLQKTGSVPAHQLLSGNVKAAASFAVKKGGDLVSRQLKNRCLF